MTQERQPKSSGSETADALADVLEDQAERAERRESASAAKVSTDAAARIGAVLLLPVMIWLWTSPPALLRPEPIAPPPRFIEAGVSMDLYVAAVQIQDHREEHGRLPAALLDALEGPEDGEGITYEVLGSGRYRLTLVRGESAQIYDSTEPLSTLVGRARPTLEGNE